MRIDCPWSVRGFCKETSFSVDISMVSNARQLIEERIRRWWPSVEIERHEDMEGNENIFLYENKQMFNECHSHGACLHTSKSVINLRLDGKLARLIIFDDNGRPIYIVDDIVRMIQSKRAPRVGVLPNLAS